MSYTRDSKGRFTKATIPLVRNYAVIDLTGDEDGHTNMIVPGPENDPEDEFPMPADPNFWRDFIIRTQERALEAGLLVNVIDLTQTQEE